MGACASEEEKSGSSKPRASKSSEEKISLNFVLIEDNVTLEDIILPHDATLELVKEVCYAAATEDENSAFKKQLRDSQELDAEQDIAAPDLALRIGGALLTGEDSTLVTLGIADGAVVHVTIDEEARKKRIHGEYVASLGGDLNKAVREQDHQAVSTLLHEHEKGSQEVTKAHIAIAMQDAAQANDVPTLTLLVEAQKDLVNTPAIHNGFTAVHAAAQGNAVDAMQLLLDNNGDPNAQALVTNLRVRGATPIYVAAMNNSTEALTLLLDNGGDANKALSNGATPLHVAQYSKSEESSILLRTRGGVVTPPMPITRGVAAVPVALVVTPLLFVFGGLFLNKNNNRVVLNNTAGRVAGRDVLTQADGSVRAY